MDEEIINIFKSLFFHVSLHIILKNPHIYISTKNTAIWCLNNLICENGDNKVDTIGNLMDSDFLLTIKFLLKDKNNYMLFENVI